MRFDNALSRANGALADALKEPPESTRHQQLKDLQRAFLEKAFDHAQVLVPLYDTLLPAAAALESESWKSTVASGLSAIEVLLHWHGQRWMRRLQEPTTAEQMALDDTLPAPTRQQHASEILQQMALETSRAADYKAFAQAVLDGPMTDRDTAADGMKPRSMAKRIAKGSSMLLAAIAGHATHFHDVRMKSHDLPDTVRLPLENFTPLRKEIGRLTLAIEHLEKDGGAMEAKTRLLGNLEALIDDVQRTADRFAVAVLNEWEVRKDGAALWQHATEYTDTLAAFAGPYLKIISESFGGPASVTEQAPQQPGASTAPQPVPSDEASGSRQKKGRPRRRSHAPQSPQQPAVPSAADVRTAALKKADDILNKRPALTSQMVAEASGDPLALAPRALEDTPESRHDPIKFASGTRSSVQSRFGRIADLRKARNLIGALEGGPDTEVQTRLAQLDERIAALDQVHARIREVEVEALKQHKLPDGDHVERLLTLGQIQSVSASLRLPSNGDDGHRGRLFELQIQPQPLADGRPANPLFLHVHTRRLVSAEECRALPFSSFTAAHVKTRQQKNLGPQWEAMQRSLHKLRVHVHRGEVKDALWDKLKARLPA